jgi:co-chaperonin GroES (HSP10)
MATVFEPRQIKNIRALHDQILVCDMNFDQKITYGGIIIPSTDGKLEGIHARWGRVYAVGPKQKEVQVGQYVCVSHGRWTRGIEIEDPVGKKIIRKIDNKDILLVSNDPMQDETIGRGL